MEETDFSRLVLKEEKFDIGGRLEGAETIGGIDMVFSSLGADGSGVLIRASLDDSRDAGAATTFASVEAGSKSLRCDSPEDFRRWMEPDRLCGGDARSWCGLDDLYLRMASSHW